MTKTLEVYTQLIFTGISTDIYRYFNWYLPVFSLVQSFRT